MKKENWWIPKEFDVDNSHLAGLASHAAVGIDNHILGRGNTDYSPVIRLGKLMYRATDPEIDSNRITVKDNPELIVFLYKLFEEFDGTKITTSEEVVKRTRETGLDLLKMRELPSEKQKRLGKFCCKLSQKIISYQPHRFGAYAI